MSSVDEQSFWPTICSTGSASYIYATNEKARPKKKHPIGFAPPKPKPPKKRK